MRLLTFDEVLTLYYRIIRDTGGAAGILNESAIKSALAQARMTFDGIDLYPTIIEKASAIGHSLVSNHPFLDGNKRIGHAVMEAVLLRNGYEIVATVDAQEEIILNIAKGELNRRALSEWLAAHTALRSSR
jgi:death-on-curing protein